MFTHPRSLSIQPITLEELFLAFKYWVDARRHSTFGESVLLWERISSTSLFIELPYFSNRSFLPVISVTISKSLR